MKFSCKNTRRRSKRSHRTQNMLKIGKLFRFLKQASNVRKRFWHKRNFRNFVTSLAHFFTAFTDIYYRIFKIVHAPYDFYAECKRRIVKSGHVKVLFKINVCKILRRILVCKRKRPSEQSRPRKITATVLSAYTADSQNARNIHHSRKTPDVQLLLLTQIINAKFGNINIAAVFFQRFNIFLKRFAR